MPSRVFELGYLPTRQVTVRLLDVLGPAGWDIAGVTPDRVFFRRETGQSRIEHDRFEAAIRGVTLSAEAPHQSTPDAETPGSPPVASQETVRRKHLWLAWSRAEEPPGGTAAPPEGPAG